MADVTAGTCTEGILKHVFRLLTIVVCCVGAAACSKPPQRPIVTPPGGSETITGSERIGWDQRAGDAVELAAISYVIYVDGNRVSLADVTCSSSPSVSGFPCSARLPPMSAGTHALQLASVVNDGGPLESARSDALNVTVAVQSAADWRPPNAAARSVTVTRESIAIVAGTRLRVELVIDGLQNPSDIAFIPDGRLLVAERAGTVRIVPRQARGASDGSAAIEPALSLAEPGIDRMLVALAVDPQFERSRFVYMLYADSPRSVDPTFTLARFRESAGTLADRVVLVDGVGAAPRSSAGALRFGPDGLLYAAFDDGGDPRRRSDRASLNGKVIRINPDGTTPRDQAGGTPVYAEGFGAPVGVAWDVRRETVWVADRDGNGTLRAIVADPAALGGEKRGVLRGAFALPDGNPPAALAFYDAALIPELAGSMLVASEAGRRLLKIAGRSVETLLQNQGAIRSVAVAPDGAIYFANGGAIGRIVPDAPSADHRR
jgi:glucose/arabinose dehydrogenase